MRYSSTVPLVTVLLASASAVPVEDTEKGFSLPVTHRAGPSIQNGPKAFDHAVRKWGVSKDFSEFGSNPDLKLNNETLVFHKRAQDTTATATPEAGDVEYLVPVKVGTPPQTLNLNIDTGSSDLWVMSTLQATSQTSGHSKFNPSKSSSWKNLSSATWKIQYADGSGASGSAGTDKVMVGKATVNAQVVELAKTMSSSFTNGGNDGLMGLAFGNINTVRPSQARTWFENVMSSLSNRIFTAYLRHATVGAYDFGYIDSKKYTGTIRYTGLKAGSGFWEFPSVYYKVGSTNYTLPSTATGIADTGTTLLLVSSAACQNYYKTIPNAQSNSQVGGWIMPCNANPPTFSFNIGPNVATISGKNVIYGSSLGSIGNTQYCFGAMQPITGNQYIFGDVFFKQNYAVFDYGKSRFGFAPHVYP